MKYNEKSRMQVPRTALFLLLLTFSTWSLGCGDNNNVESKVLDISVCAPDAGPFARPFSLTIDNDFFPLPVGQQWILEGEEDGTALHIEITVLDETEDVAGVTTRVVEEREWEDRELIEVSRNFFVQAPDGTVCYYGEDVNIYEGGEVVSHEGQWRAGEGENKPGIMMPANPSVGMIYAQESAPGIAEDMAEIMAFGETVSVPAGEFNDTMRVRDWNPLDPASGFDTKYYARGIRIVKDGEAELISY